MNMVQPDFSFVSCWNLYPCVYVADSHSREAIAASLSQELLRGGWQQLGHPGSPVRRFTKGASEIDVDHVFGGIAAGSVDEALWRSGTQLSSIASLNVAVPSPVYSHVFGAPGMPATRQQTLPPEPGQPGWQPPMPPAAAQHVHTSSERDSRARHIYFGVLAALLVVVLAIRIFSGGSSSDTSLANATPSSGGSSTNSPAASPHSKGLTARTELTADGKSNLPGGGASLTYKPIQDDFEVSGDGNLGGGPHDGATWDVEHWNPDGNGRTMMEVKEYIFEPKPTTPARIKSYVRADERWNTKQVGHSVKTKRETLDGRTAYTWEFINSDNDWVHYTDAFALTHSYRLYCITPVDNSNNFRQRCRNALATIKFKTKN